MKDRINIGLTVMAVDDANIWNSGLNQNLAFMVPLLRKLPFVGKIWLLNGGPAEVLPAGLQLDRFDAPLVRAEAVTHEIDLVIELGATMPLEWLRHVRALGARIVTLFVGHTFGGNVELPLFDKPGGAPFNATPWHEVWTLPHHMKSSGPMLRTIARVPVRSVPHIWAPVFLDEQVARLAASGHEFGFNPQRRSRASGGWRCAIFEPNLSVVKNCYIPMLVCDSAYRRNPEAVGFMMVMNTFHMKDHPTFNRFASHLDLTRASRASYEPRLAFAECMAVNFMDAVVAHQWECGLNYAYYDALHGGYPLVHNSEFLRDDGVGLYYPEFEASAGAQALIEAWAAPPEFWSDYRQRAREFLARIHPEHTAIQQAYAALITNLMEAGDGGA